MAEQETNPIGRPLKFQSVEELETAINGYFDWCDKEYDTRKWSHDEIEVDANGKRVCLSCWQTLPSRGCMLISGERKERKPYTVTGLALWLDTTRRTLLDYQAKDSFSHTILRAKQRIENYAAEALFDSGVPTRGVIFSLSNNHEWAEKTETVIDDRRDAAQDLADKFLGKAATLPPDETLRTGEEPEAGAA